MEKFTLVHIAVLLLLIVLPAIGFLVTINKVIKKKLREAQEKMEELIKYGRDVQGHLAVGIMNRWGRMVYTIDRLLPGDKGRGDYLIKVTKPDICVMEISVFMNASGQPRIKCGDTIYECNPADKELFVNDTLKLLTDPVEDSLITA